MTELVSSESACRRRNVLVLGVAHRINKAKALFATAHHLVAPQVSQHVGDVPTRETRGGIDR